MIDYYAVVVLYNKKMYDSITIKNLLQINDKSFHIIVLDNSTEAYVKENKNSFISDSVTYYSMGGNVGLSKAYNFALTILKEKCGEDIVIWFDDDTPVDQEYINCLKKNGENRIYDVFVPIIYGQNGVIYSPNEIGWLKGKYISEPSQEINKNKFNAINSCLAVRLKIYNNYRYDERLFMDCVDTKLFDDFRRMNVKFCVLPVKVHQNFFQHGDDKDINKYWRRFEIRIRDTLYYSQLGGYKKKMSGYIKVIGWSIIYGMKLKSCKFSYLCLKQIFTLRGKK